MLARAAQRSSSPHGSSKSSRSSWSQSTGSGGAPPMKKPPAAAATPPPAVSASPKLATSVSSPTTPTASNAASRAGKPRPPANPKLSVSASEPTPGSSSRGGAGALHAMRGQQSPGGSLLSQAAAPAPLGGKRLSGADIVREDLKKQIRLVSKDALEMQEKKAALMEKCSGFEAKIEKLRAPSVTYLRAREQIDSRAVEINKLKTQLYEIGMGDTTDEELKRRTAEVESHAAKLSKIRADRLFLTKTLVELVGGESSMLGILDSAKRRERFSSVDDKERKKSTAGVLKNQHYANYYNAGKWDFVQPVDTPTGKRVIILPPHEKELIIQQMFEKEKAAEIEKIRASERVHKMFADEVPDSAVDNSNSTYDGEAAAASFSRTKKQLFNTSTVASIRSAGHFDQRNKARANSPRHADPRDFGTFSYEDYKAELDHARKLDNAKSDEQLYHEFKTQLMGQQTNIIKNLKSQLSEVEKNRQEHLHSFSLTR
ncbi:hypothetical protein TeGR_g4417 [Tetraparma gracilis]|uniref:Uncharacterized protein n=1 Tax=Tetraparma gracilis TaxID=2962635 RepID=A0ABQ6N3N5_9STRA|nr:hypothetical protein TeGR_g4417 [Tetraparma gracilis]